MLVIAVIDTLRSPFSLLLGKRVGPDNFWLRQFKFVGVGATIGLSVGATFGPFVGATFLGSSNNLGPAKGPKVTPTVLGA